MLALERLYKTRLLVFEHPHTRKSFMLKKVLTHAISFHKRSTKASSRAIEQARISCMLRRGSNTSDLVS